MRTPLFLAAGPPRRAAVFQTISVAAALVWTQPLGRAGDMTVSADSGPHVPTEECSACPNGKPGLKICYEVYLHTDATLPNGTEFPDLPFGTDFHVQVGDGNAAHFQCFTIEQVTEDGRLLKVEKGWSGGHASQVDASDWHVPIRVLPNCGVAGSHRTVSCVGDYDQHGSMDLL